MGTKAARLEHWLLVIPARLNSERLPRKPLQDLCGKPLVVRTFENLKPLTDLGATIVVGADDKEIKDCCDRFAIPCQLTATTHMSGSDRIGEVAQNCDKSLDMRFIMNVQVDEPFLDVSELAQAAENFSRVESPFMGTMVYKDRDSEEFADPNVVKVISTSGYGLFFSRSPIPFYRDGTKGADFYFWRHLGVYLYSREGLSTFLKLPKSPLEKIEKLEQLRAIDNGYKIWLHESKSNSMGIDTYADLEKARQRI
jgi:3-deoxy-manno-octulosonate cytidylyltransferase (CMP-KDO synthetase)